MYLYLHRHSSKRNESGVMLLMRVVPHLVHWFEPVTLVVNGFITSWVGDGPSSGKGSSRSLSGGQDFTFWVSDGPISDIFTVHVSDEPRGRGSED